jgi:N-acetylmuramoyl-L-alanine amidase
MKGDLVEKDITFEIAMHMQRMLAEKGADVLLSRGETSDTTLEQRAALGNASGADILVSVHVNAANNTNASGSSTWFNAPEGDDSHDRAACRKLADCIQKAMLAAGGLSDYGIREANFAVLRASLIPAVLVEVAFLTNTGDAAKLSDPKFRERLAEGIVNGILDYFRLD